MNNYFESYLLIKKIGGGTEYYHNPLLFWFNLDPKVVIILDENGNILLKEIFSSKQISIYEYWPKFSHEQRMIIAHNLDKFV